MLELVQQKTEAELLETLDWVYITADDNDDNDENIVYAKLESAFR